MIHPQETQITGCSFRLACLQFRCTCLYSFHFFNFEQEKPKWQWLLYQKSCRLTFVSSRTTTLLLWYGCQPKEISTVVQEVEKSFSNQKVANSIPCRSVLEQDTEPLIA